MDGPREAMCTSVVVHRLTRMSTRKSPNKHKDTKSTKIVLVPRLCLGTRCPRGSASPESKELSLIQMTAGRACWAVRSQAEPGNEKTQRAQRKDLVSCLCALCVFVLILLVSKQRVDWPAVIAGDVVRPANGVADLCGGIDAQSAVDRWRRHRRHGPDCVPRSCRRHRWRHRPGRP